MKRHLILDRADVHQAVLKGVAGCAPDVKSHVCLSTDTDFSHVCLSTTLHWLRGTRTRRCWRRADAAVFDHSQHHDPLYENNNV